MGDKVGIFNRMTRNVQLKFDICVLMCAFVMFLFPNNTHRVEKSMVWCVVLLHPIKKSYKKENRNVFSIYS